MKQNLLRLAIIIRDELVAQPDHWPSINAALDHLLAAVPPLDAEERKELLGLVAVALCGSPRPANEAELAELAGLPPPLGTRTRRFVMKPKTVFELGAMIGEYMQDHDSADVGGFVDFVVGCLVGEGASEGEVSRWYQARAVALSRRLGVERLTLEDQERAEQAAEEREGAERMQRERLTTLELEHGRQRLTTLELEHGRQRLTTVELEAGELEGALNAATQMLVTAARKTDALARELGEQRAAGDASMRLDHHLLDQLTMLGGIVRFGFEELESMLAVLRSEKIEC